MARVRFVRALEAEEVLLVLDPRLIAPARELLFVMTALATWMVLYYLLAPKQGGRASSPPERDPKNRPRHPSECRAWVMANVLFTIASAYCYHVLAHESGKEWRLAAIVVGVGALTTAVWRGAEKRSGRAQRWTAEARAAAHLGIAIGGAITLLIVGIVLGARLLD